MAEEITTSAATGAESPAPAPQPAAPGQAAGQTETAGLGNTAGTAVEARLDEIYSLQRADPKTYRSSEIQDELRRLEAERLGVPQAADPAQSETGNRPDGVPETADDYAIPEIEGHTWDDTQKADIGEFFEAAHAAGMSQQQVDAALTALAEANAKSMAAFNDQARSTARVTEAALRQELGNAFVENRERANIEARRIWGEAAPDVMNVRLADGSYLGDNLGFVRGLIGLTKTGATSSARGVQDAASTPTAGPSLNAQLDGLYNLKTTNYKLYKSPETQATIMRLEAERLGIRG